VFGLDERWVLPKTGEGQKTEVISLGGDSESLTGSKERPPYISSPPKEKADRFDWVPGPGGRKGLAPDEPHTRRAPC